MSGVARPIFLARLFAFALALAATNPAWAQSYPVKPVYFIIGLSVGKSSDTTLRIIANKLSQLWGQPVLVFNRPGASGNIAADLVAKAAPDGYTLLLSNDSIAIAPSYFKKLPYDPVKSLVPVSEVTSMPQMVCVTPSLPVNSLKDLIALAKAKPDGLTYSSVGAGQTDHMATELFAYMTGIKMRHIPYSVSTQALTALVTGEVDVKFTGLAPTLPVMQAGKVRCLAVTAADRSPVVPDIPTLKESGITGYDHRLWAGVFAPVGTPQAIIDKVSRDIALVLKMPDVHAHLTPFSIELIGSTPTQFKAFFNTEVVKWAKVITATGIGGD